MNVLFYLKDSIDVLNITSMEHARYHGDIANVFWKKTLATIAIIFSYLRSNEAKQSPIVTLSIFEQIFGCILGFLLTLQIIIIHLDTPLSFIFGDAICIRTTQIIANIYLGGTTGFGTTIAVTR